MLTNQINNRRGAAYILALVTMLAGCVLALALLRAGHSRFLTEDSRTKKQAETHIAQAGIEYAYYMVHHQGRPLPFVADVTLESGSFHVEAVDNGAVDASTMLITSTGKTGASSGVTIKRVTLGLLPFHYTWCENASISSNNPIISTDSVRGFRTNSDVFLLSFNNNISSGVWSVGPIISLGYVNPRISGNPPIAFPDINFNYYRSAADYVYNSNTQVTSLNFTYDTLIVINGNAVINLTQQKYRGVVTIVCSGDISVQSNLNPNDTNSYLSLISAKSITFQSGSLSVTGAFYAHNSNNSAYIQIKGQTTVTGTVAADDIVNDGKVNISRGSRSFDSLQRSRLPGL